MKRTITILSAFAIVSIGTTKAQTTPPADSRTSPTQTRTATDTRTQTQTTTDANRATIEAVQQTQPATEANNRGTTDSRDATDSKNETDARRAPATNANPQMKTTADNRADADLNRSANANQNASKMDSEKRMMQSGNKMAIPDLTTWPTASRMAVEEATSKYGQPDGITEHELYWLNKDMWKKICITKTETKHSFPLEHTDMMTQTISYNVPEDKMDDLGKFDGSVTFDRTQGTMSARCDKEGNNILALNLAHDVVTGKKTVEQARKAFGDIAKEKMNGGNPAYMQSLTFKPQANAADPDKNTTGLTKDGMKGMKKTGKE